MGDYWIRDAELRVLGPVSLAVLRDLVAARRLLGVEEVSRDGVTWAAVGQFPELALPPSVDQNEARQREEAEALRQELAALAARPSHEVFEVPLDAPPAAYRASYFNLARRYHPARLPAGAQASLVTAYQEAFRFYSQRMAEVEERLAPSAAGGSPQPREYRAEDFVGIERRTEGRIHANVRVTLGNFGMFTDHRLMNISMGGMFLATEALIPLGTLVDLELSFEGEGRRVAAQARVVWESSGADPRHARGVGVKFTQLGPEDAIFIRDFVRRAAAHRRPPSR